MNNDTMEKLNYNKLKEMVKSYCSSSLGRNLIDKLHPSSSIKEVKRRLSETTEGRCLLDADYHIPLEGISNVTVLIDKIDKNGVLDPSELISISDFLRGCRKIKGFMKNKEGYAPTLSAYGENISELCEIEENINKAINGIMPKVNDCGYTKINKGRYPLIENSVPLDYEIGKDYRTLIITGPNAGGKTVVLKTIGILTLATESGFHIAAEEGTEVSIFDNIFVDIGDNQSIENSLSTFSSHVKNLANILKRTNNSTLLLFDEIGSGTEPNEGAALAIAMLEEFYYKGESAIVYKEMDRFNNIIVLYKKEFLEVNYKRVKLEIKREDLYPEDYDMDQLFVDFKTRKMNKDIERGSKKALNEIRKNHMK